MQIQLCRKVKVEGHEFDQASNTQYISCFRWTCQEYENTARKSVSDTFKYNYSYSPAHARRTYARP
ncbi:hypothetical protein KSC_075540 [Ktedonobacter sp. SOSP1-52]|nr:hypothetical protein KSC_075540 [Ktedonobacter sp. SOSP1-52]